MRAIGKLLFLMVLLGVACIAGCASNTSSSSTSQDVQKGDTAFGNILVLAIADNYDGRAQYERAVTSGLRKLGILATPYHQAVGGSGQISRERARELIDANGFDAVLVTQVRSSQSSVDVKQDSADMKVVRRNDRPVDFFRYDYEELDEPGEISVLAEATLDTDLHSADDSSIVWTYSWSSKGAKNAGLLIDESAAALVRRLKRDKLVNNQE